MEDASPQSIVHRSPQRRRSSFWGRGTAATSPLEGTWKKAWRLVSQMPQRIIFKGIYPSSLCYVPVEQYPSVQGFVGLTIDDAPGQLGPGASRLHEVQALLAEHDAHATFFVISDFVEGHEHQLGKLVANGHELANHCTSDRSFFIDTETGFEQALLETEQKIDAIQRPEKRWFRAPKGMLSLPMMRVLHRHGYKHVVGDCYANDCEIGDPEFIANHMLEHVQSGSIIIIHTPEIGLREWNFKALHLILEGLKARQLKALNLTDLSKKAEESGRELQLNDGPCGKTWSMMSQVWNEPKRLDNHGSSSQAHINGVGGCTNTGYNCCVTGVAADSHEFSREAQ